VSRASSLKESRRPPERDLSGRFLRPLTSARQIRLEFELVDLGLGLSVARQGVETVGGTLTVRNLEGVGCVFTIELPKSTVERRGESQP
jgi:signal transduction histidine kinase